MAGGGARCIYGMAGGGAQWHGWRSGIRIGDDWGNLPSLVFVLPPKGQQTAGNGQRAMLCVTVRDWSCAVVDASRDPSHQSNIDSIVYKRIGTKNSKKMGAALKNKQLCSVQC